MFHSLFCKFQTIAVLYTYRVDDPDCLVCLVVSSAIIKSAEVLSPREEADLAALGILLFTL